LPDFIGTSNSASTIVTYLLSKTFHRVKRRSDELNDKNAAISITSLDSGSAAVRTGLEFI
jgi:hypothetical protein